MKMDLDTICIEPLIHDWLQQIHEENEQRENILKNNSEFYVPYMAVPMPIIKAIFVITGHFELGPNSRYRTVFLYDNFMCKHFYELYLSEIKAEPNENLWAETCKRISSQAKLHLMSCIQLASKMDSHSKGLGISQVMSMLRRIDRNHEYTRNVIFFSELKVFKTLGFKIPLSTPLHCVEILLAATGLKETPGIYDTSINILDFAYLQHEQLYSRLYFMARGRFLKSREDKKYFMAMENNVPLLGASVVLCATFFLYLQQTIAKFLVIKLSHLVKIRDRDIWDMANLMFTMIVQGTEF